MGVCLRVAVLEDLVSEGLFPSVADVMAFTSVILFLVSIGKGAYGYMVSN